MTAPSAERRIPSSPKFRAFAVLQVGSFRALWINSFSFSLLQSMQRFTFVWLVLDLGRGAGSAGLIVFAITMPILVVSIPAGVLSDRMNRRVLMMVTQTVALAFTLGAVALMAAGQMTFGAAVALAVGIGAAQAAGQPVRMALVASVVPREQLLNAIVLTTGAMNVSFIVGPALGGGVIALTGLTGAFALQAILYATGLLAISTVRIPPLETTARKKPLAELADGFRFLRQERAIGLLVCMSALAGFFFQTHTVLVPQIAKVEWNADAFAAAVLYSFMGVGMLTTSIALASLARAPRKGLWFMLSTALGGLPFIGFSLLSPAYFVAGIWLFAFGLTGGLYVNLNQTLIQSHTPLNLMGRVMSVHSVGMMGTGTIGGLIAGAIASLVSPTAVFATAGALLATLATLVIFRSPTLRNLD